MHKATWFGWPTNPKMEELYDAWFEAPDTAAQRKIVDKMQEIFEAGGCDGFNITPATLPGGGEDFVEMVLPELRRRGLFRSEYEGRTLRENLGLRPVVNRYTMAV